MDEGSGDEYDGDLAGIRRRARHRWRWLLAAIAVASGLTGVFASALFDASDRTDESHHRHHSVVAIVVLVVIVVALVAAIVWMVPKFKRNTGVFAAPLVGGLRRGDRRRVSRAIRRMQPSDDPTLRGVERETAERVVRHGKFSLIVFGLVLVLELVDAVFTHHNEAGTVFYYAASVLFAAALGQQVFILGRARRYLAMTGSESRG